LSKIAYTKFYTGPCPPVETLSSQQIELLSGYLDDWENISFEDKRKAADGLISSISATSDYVKIEWKI